MPDSTRSISTWGVVGLFVLGFVLAFVVRDAKAVLLVAVGVVFAVVLWGDVRRRIRRRQ